MAASQSSWRAVSSTSSGASRASASWTTAARRRAYSPLSPMLALEKKSVTTWPASRSRSMQTEAQGAQQVWRRTVGMVIGFMMAHGGPFVNFADRLLRGPGHGASGPLGRRCGAGAPVHRGTGGIGVGQTIIATTQWLAILRVKALRFSFAVRWRKPRSGAQS